MIVDHRTYTIRHGQANSYIDLFEKEGLPVQIKHLGNQVGSGDTCAKVAANISVLDKLKG